MLALVASNNMARLPKPTHDVLGGCIKSGLFLMYVITYQKAGTARVRKNACWQTETSHLLRNGKSRSYFARSRWTRTFWSDGSRNKTDSHWFNLGMLLAGITFLWGGGGVVGKYVRAISMQQRKPKQEIGEVIIKGVGGINEVQPVTSRKEKPKSEYFESVQFKILIYSQCISIRFHRTRFLPPFFLQSAMLLL